MFLPPDIVCGPWHWKQVVWAFKRDGIDNATPRADGLWQVAQPVSRVCRECWNTALKLLSGGNLFTSVAVWHIEHIWLELP